MTPIQNSLLAEYRSTHPKSRAQSLTPLARNGAAQRIRRCVLCGDMHSECARYLETKHMSSWRREHGAAACQ